MSAYVILRLIVANDIYQQKHCLFQDYFVFSINLTKGRMFHTS